MIDLHGRSPRAPVTVPSGEPRSKALQSLLMESPPGKQALKRMIPGEIRRWLSGRIRKANLKEVPLDAEVRRDFLDYYREGIGIAFTAAHHSAMAPQADFFVVGTARAATTALYTTLASLDGLFLSRIKEPNHFATDLFDPATKQFWSGLNDVDIDQYFSSGSTDTINFGVVEKRAYYDMLFSDAAPGHVCGEMSTTYLFSAQAAGNIHAYNPNARIIAILRNPVERLISHYALYRRMGRVSCSLGDLMAQEASLGSAPYGKKLYLFEYGLYAEQIQRYKDLFPEEQLLFVLYEELVSPSADALKQIFDFLGVSDEDGSPTLRKVNASAVPRVPTISTVLSALNIKPVLRTLLGTRLIDRLRPLYFGKAKRPTIDPGLRRELWVRYADEVARLEPLIGHRLDVWRQANGS